MVELNLFLPFNVLCSPAKNCKKMSKIEINNVYKIFGPSPKSVLPMVKDGASKEEILENTGLPINQLVKGMTKRHQENLNIETLNKHGIFKNRRLIDTVSQIENELDDKSRILVRPSGTESKIRVLVESDDPKLRSYILKTIADQVRALEKIS